MTTKPANKPARNNSKPAGSGRSRSTSTASGADAKKDPNAEGNEGEENSGTASDSNEGGSDADNGTDTNTDAPTPIDPAELANLSKEELIARLLGTAAKVNELEKQVGNRKAREPKEKVRTPEQVRKDELTAIWETLTVDPDDAIRSKDRADQLAALPKLARLLPWDALPVLLTVIAEDVIEKRTAFVNDHKVDTDKIDLFGEPRTVETLIEMAMVRKPKNQPKKNVAADDAALNAADAEGGSNEGEHCPDPDAHKANEGEEGDGNESTEGNETEE